MLGNPSERNLKQIINGGDNPMRTPVDHYGRAEDSVTNRVTRRQTNTTEQRPEAAPFITLIKKSVQFQITNWFLRIWNGFKP